MDCEGGEWEILKDADSWKNVRNITMEYHLWPGKHTTAEIYDKVKALGFKIVKTKTLSNYTGMILARRK